MSLNCVFKKENLVYHRLYIDEIRGFGKQVSFNLKKKKIDYYKNQF